MKKSILGSKFGLHLDMLHVGLVFLRNISLANMFDRYDNEGTLWNIRCNICLQRFVIWNCDNLQLLVSLVAIKQLLIIIDNLFDPYCNNYSPQREQHPSSWILNQVKMDQNLLVSDFVVIFPLERKNLSWLGSRHILM